MSERLIRDRRVLAKWLHKFRLCLLLQDHDRGPLAVYAPAAGDETTPLEECPPAALASGLVAARNALQAARRVIETGKDERHAWSRSLEGAGISPEAFEHQSNAYGNALAGFEKRYGSRYPITEDLTRAIAP
jgi:hypothetical protein